MIPAKFRTLLHIAVENRDELIIAPLVTNGVDMGVVDGSGNTVLYSAAQTDGSATPRERSYARRGKYTLQRAMGSRRWWRLW